MTTVPVLAHTEQPNQLSLPSGPVGLVRPRRDRTDSDRQWYNGQLKVQHSKHWDKVVYEKVSYYGSLNPERLAFPSVARLAREVVCSARTVQRALRRLEAGGLIKCVSRAGGHATSQYLVVGLRVTLGATASHPRGDCEAPNDIREGKREVRTKDPSLSVSIGAQTIDPGAVEESLATDTVKSIDPALLEKVEKEIGVDYLPFPSQEQEQERAERGGTLGSKMEPKVDEPPTLSEVQESTPVPEGTVFVNKKQVDLLFKLQRKLGYRADDGQAGVFDRLEHADRKRILDRLVGEEQLAAAQGKVTAPPKAEPSPRHKFPLTCGEECKVRQRPTCETHRWTPPASDGISNCFDCDHEEKRE